MPMLDRIAFADPLQVRVRDLLTGLVLGSSAKLAMPQHGQQGLICTNNSSSKLAFLALGSPLICLYHAITLEALACLQLAAEHMPTSLDFQLYHMSYGVCGALVMLGSVSGGVIWAYPQQPGSNARHKASALWRSVWSDKPSCQP